MSKPSRRPLGLALQMPADADQSYRVDEHGAFVHGHINIGADGMQMQSADAAAGASSHLTLSSEEAEELQRLKRDDTRLEDLDFMEKLGEGNSSVVHRAHDRRQNRDFAVKRINIFDKSKRHQIIKELQTLYKCDCPHLIQMHGAFFKDGAISIALELMDVGSLADVLQAVKTIDEAELAYLARPLLQGLDYLRRSHKVHRDIKPSNICLNSNASAKLSDFGITTSLDSTLAACNSFVGTSAYMSPERLLGQAYKYPSDVWSLGLVFLECAVGKFPFDLSGVYLDMMQNIINGPSPSLPRAADGSFGRFSKEFANFIDCCLSKSPEARSTAEELLLHPWFKRQKDTRSHAQMVQWTAAVKQKILDKQKGERERADAMDTRTSGAAQPQAGAASAATNGRVSREIDPFEAGYNQTETNSAQAADQGRNNVPQNDASSFYSVKPIL